MPYIPEQDRLEILGREPSTPGELNFGITRFCLQYIENHGLVYDKINDVIGALECVKQEFYRRLVVPYEDKKKELNGDVYKI